MDRRSFLRRGAAIVVGPVAARAAVGTEIARAEETTIAATGPEIAAAEPAIAPAATAARKSFPLEEATIDDLQQAMQKGRLSSADLVRLYSERIEAMNERGPALRAVIEMNPEASAIAASLDAERKAGRARGPLHGIPILVKDNIDTADRMETTAGSLALLGTRPREDATVVRRLREAGAVILGKTNLSEWANIRSRASSSGWSGRGRQCRNPYVLTHNPCGSSSGSAVAVSANLCAAALGTETDGSVVCPSHVNGIVGIKPTVGLTSRAGVVPIAHSQDTVGTHARTVRDAAILLAAIAGGDPRDPATGALATGALAGPAPKDLTASLDPEALRGARIGIARKVFFGYSDPADRVIEAAISAMSRAGAVIVDPADIQTLDAMNASDDELTVLLYELKADLNAYLATRVPASGIGAAVVRTLEDAIAFNQAHAKEEMPYFGQDLFLEAQAKGPLTDTKYLEALDSNRRLSREKGLDAVFAQHELDALIAPTGGPAWPIDPVNGDHFKGASSSPAAMAGYPLVTVPAGEAFGLPIGITFMGLAGSEPKLIRLAHAFETATRARTVPRMLPSLELP